MDHDDDSSLVGSDVYGVDVDDPILIEINRKLDSRVTIMDEDGRVLRDCDVGRPLFPAVTLDVDFEELL